MINLQLILAVAAGGAAGSVARFIVGVWSTRAFGLEFPWGTLIINITGSFLIGVFAELFALHWDAPQSLRVLLTVGICGGYTTFSTFSFETIRLLETGRAGSAVRNVVLNAAGGLLLAGAGLGLAAWA